MNLIRIHLDFDFGLLRNGINQWICFLIKVLMQVIRVAVTLGVTSLLSTKPSENSSTMSDRDPQRTNYAQAGPCDSNYACINA
jgi:alanine racemase